MSWVFVFVEEQYGPVLPRMPRVWDSVPMKVTLAEGEARLYLHQLHGLHRVLERSVWAERTESAEIVRSLERGSRLSHGVYVQLPAERITNTIRPTNKKSVYNIWT